MSIPMHIKAAHMAWHPAETRGDCGFDYLHFDPQGVYWYLPGKIISSTWHTGEQSPGQRVEEEVYIPGSPEQFEPCLSPMTMMDMGIFGNAYWGSLQESTTYPLGKARHSILPIYKGRDRFQESYSDRAQWKTAWFQKKASLSRAWWMERQLISNLDPLGWFEWYCWYWLGRRHAEEDTRQIKRWCDFRRRQSAMLDSKPNATGLKQALLHWSCDPWICD